MSSASELFAKKKKGKKKFKAFNANTLDVSDVSSSQHVDDVSQKGGEQQGKAGGDGEWEEGDEKKKVVITSQQKLAEFSNLEDQVKVVSLCYLLPRLLSRPRRPVRPTPPRRRYHLPPRARAPP